MECKPADTADHACGGHGRSGLPGARPWLRLVLVTLLCVTAFGCGRDRGGAGGIESQASVAPGTESSVAGPDGEPGSASESGTTAGRGSGSRPGSGSGGEPGAAPGSPGGDAGPRPPSAPGAPGAPTDPGDPGDPGEEPTAPGTPIKLPPFINKQGKLFETAKAEIEAEIVKACGGTLCLDIVVEQRGDTHPSCFVETDPPTTVGIEVPRDSKLVLVRGANENAEFPCLPDPDPDPDPDLDPSGGQQPPSSS